ncbi:MerR family transcriptional regulator [Enterococcus plantarum]|uniref:MerR family transcriptional regulator n=1 Tax=Enterococcus plantarum TaxID=1077675 RepID=UPI001A8C19F9|nr:MerR family transcriptional regulator [Enterococcus plantarum]MBO0468675.1 MerR family transcriptional regulator [Enterococcus plantarum]
MKTYTVKEVSEIMNISPYTLRFYDKKGLFPFVKRNSKNVREFNEEDLEWVYIVMCLRATGLSISNVQHYITLFRQGDETVKNRLDLLIEQRSIIKRQLVELNEKSEMLEYKIAVYQGMINGNEVSLHNPISEKVKNRELVKNSKLRLI